MGKWDCTIYGHVELGSLGLFLDTYTIKRNENKTYALLGTCEFFCLIRETVKLYQNYMDQNKPYIHIAISK